MVMLLFFGLVHVTLRVVSVSFARTGHLQICTFPLIVDVTVYPLQNNSVAFEGRVMTLQGPPRAPYTYRITIPSSHRLDQDSFHHFGERQDVVVGSCSIVLRSSAPVQILSGGFTPTITPPPPPMGYN